MIPNFNFSQTSAERTSLIKKVLTRSKLPAEQVEAEISTSFAKCGMDLRVAEIGQNIQAEPVGVYDAGEKDFSAIPGGGPVIGSQQVSGPGFSYGLLADLLEAHAICGRHGIAFEDFAGEFKGSHLTCIQEVLALGAWPHATNVVRGFKATDGKKNVDWKFISKEKTVLLEVKFRRTDWRRNHPETVTYKTDNLFGDIAEKFPPASPEIWRIAHINVVQPVDDEIAEACSRFLKCAPVDSVIVEPLNQAGAPVIFGENIDEVRAHMEGSLRTYMRPGKSPIIFRRPSKH